MTTKTNRQAPYEEGWKDGSEGADPKRRTASYEAVAAAYITKTREDLENELAELCTAIPESARNLAEAEGQLAGRQRAGQSLVTTLIYCVLILLGLAAELLMTQAVVELWFGAAPLLLWPATIGIASLAPLGAKLAVSEHPVLGRAWPRPICVAISFLLSAFLSYHRAAALVLEAQAGEYLVADLVGDRLWLTFFTLLLVTMCLSFGAAVLIEIQLRDRRTRKLSRIAREHRETEKTLRLKQTTAQNSLTGLEARVSSELRVTTLDYERGHADGTRAREGAELESSRSTVLGSLRRLWPVAVLLLATSLSTACSGDSFTSTAPQNAMAVVLDPYGVVPMPTTVALEIATSVVARAPRCTKILFLTSRGVQEGGSSTYAVNIPCSAARTRRDRDLSDKYTTFADTFPKELARWFDVPDPRKNWDVDYTGTLRLASQELRSATGSRTLLVISPLFWPDPKDPAALAPLPEFDFSGTRTFLGFTHGDFVDYESVYRGRRLRFVDNGRTLAAWKQKFVEWGVSKDQLSTAVFGPEGARIWIQNNLGEETAAYGTWRQSQARADQLASRAPGTKGGR